MVVDLLMLCVLVVVLEAIGVYCLLTLDLDLESLNLRLGALNFGMLDLVG